MKESLAARQVAEEVVRTVRKGKIPNVGAISVKHGYSVQSAKANKAVRTKTYQRHTLPYVQRMERERERILKAMENKELKYEEYETLSKSANRFTHDIQLLSGKATDNVAVAGVEISFRE